MDDQPLRIYAREEVVSFENEEDEEETTVFEENENEVVKDYSEEIELEEVVTQEDEEKYQSQIPQGDQTMFYIVREEQRSEGDVSVVQEFEVEINQLKEMPPTKKRKREPEPPSSIPNQCPLCGITPRLKKVTQHIVWCKKLLEQYLTIRNTSPRCHKCLLCMYATDRSDSLTQHMLRHAPGHKGNPHFIRLRSYEVFSHKSN